MKTILYVVDALRADHLSCYGYERDTSPRIDMFCEDACVFSNASAQSTWTRASAGAILTGLYPPTTGLISKADHFPQKSRPFPVYFPEDVKTACISAMGNVSSAFGFDQYFDEFVDLYKATDRQDEKEVISNGKMFQQAREVGPVINPTSLDINNELFSWIRRHQDQDFFVLVWSIDPHAPYEPMDRFRQFSADQTKDKKATYQSLRQSASHEDAQWIIDRYDDLICQNDHAFGELISHLRKLGIYEETNLILTGDHGEAFGEHGVFGHATVPYEEVIHVPLIVKMPVYVDGAETIYSTVEHTDIAPTILDLYDVQFEFPPQGESLVPAIKETGNLVGGPAFSYTKFRLSAPTFISYRNKKWKYIRVEPPDLKDVFQSDSTAKGLRSWLKFSRRYGFVGWDESLFPVKSDGVDESVSMVEEEKEVSGTMREKVNKIFSECASLQRGGQKIQRLPDEIDEATRNQLEDLGYL